MIALNAHKDCTIQFDIDVKNMSPADLRGHFRLIHENIEYGFPVRILGNRNKAQVTIPALNGIIPNLTEADTFDARIEFVGGSDYVQAWADTAKINPSPKVEIEIKEATVISESEPESKTETRGIVSNIEVSDEIWKKAKPINKKVKDKIIAEADKKYEDGRADLKKSLTDKGGFSDFFSKG